MKCIGKAAIGDVLSLLGKSFDVFAPVREGDRLDFRHLPVEGEICLGPEKTLLPLKVLFLPVVKDILSFRRQKSEIALSASPPLGRDRVVFGAIGCDIAALDLLDPVLLSEPPDETYRERRERTTIIALACTGGGSECFCSSLGVDPLHPVGADAVLTDVGNAFVFENVTHKGRRIFDILEKYMREADDAEEATTRALVSASRDDVPTEGIPTDFAGLWESDLWDEIAVRCIGCGVCTLLCPTCYCFDVQDEKRGAAGTRFKAWDSCMFADFTRMAGGLNPRPSKSQRVRQRFLHKLSYYASKYGRSACVGCGRCTSHCPVGVGIDEVMARLAAVESHDG